MKISAIVPTYNRENVIKRCLHSLDNQTYQVDETILIDGSKNNKTKSTIDGIGIENLIYVRQNGSGVSNARNQGIDIANGDLLLFLDSDDELHPQAVEKMVHVLTESQPECGGVFTHYESVSKDGSITKIWDEVSGLIQANDVLRDETDVGATGSMFKSSFVNKVGGYDETMPKAEDTDLAYRIAKMEPLYIIDERLLTIHTDSEDRITEDPESILAGNQMFLKKYEDELTDDSKMKRHLGAGRAAIQIGDQSSAKNHFEQAVLLSSDDYETEYILNKIGRYYAHHNQISQAKKYFSQSVQRNWWQPTVWLNLAITLAGPTTWDTAVKFKHLIQGPRKS